MGKKVSASAKENPVINIVWAEGLSTTELKVLRKKIEESIKNPDFPIIANYEIHWDQIHIDKNAVGRVVWSDMIDEKEVEKLSLEVAKALKDPDYIIVVNYPVYWNEIQK
jgi:hypothetical protein